MEIRTLKQIFGWHEEYKKHLIDKYRLSEELAQSTLDGGMESFDYDDDPIEAADEEMSYWTD